jgi:hypothetical protein
MNSKERVKLAFSHKEADRVPVGELYINSPVASEILGRTAYTGWGGNVRCGIMNKMLIEGRGEEFFHQEVVDLVELYRKLELDMILIERPPLKNPNIPKAVDETTYRFEDPQNGMWSIIHFDKQTDSFHTIDSNFNQGGIEEFIRYVDLLEKDDINLDNWSWKQAEYIMEKCGSDMFVMAVAEIDFPPMSMGALNGVIFMEAMLAYPEICERYLDYRVRKGIKFIEKYASLGVDCIFDGEDLAGNNGPLFSPKDYMTFYAPRFRKLSDEIHKNNMLYLRHTDGNIMLFADEFLLQSGFDGYQSIDPESGMDLSLVKEKYGDKVTLMGNVDCAKALHLGTKEDVIKDTLRVIKTAAPGGGHIISSSNTIHSSIPTKNYMQMLETIRKYGEYPINPDL